LTINYLKVSHIDEIRWYKRVFLWYNEYKGNKGTMAKMIRARIPDDLHWQLKVEVAKERTTIQALIVVLIKEWLKERGIEVE